MAPVATGVIEAVAAANLAPAAAFDLLFALGAVAWIGAYRWGW